MEHKWTLADKIANLRWAINMMYARKWRTKLSFSQRERFDMALRHPVNPAGTVIAYPDALYHTDVDDVIRAMHASSRVR